MNCVFFSGDVDETYVLCEEEIQYWDRGLFMSSGTIFRSWGSQMEFSLENRNVRNYQQETECA